MISNSLYYNLSLSARYWHSSNCGLPIKINDLLTLSVVFTNIRSGLGGIRYLYRTLLAAIGSATRVVNTGCALLARIIKKIIRDNVGSPEISIVEHRLRPVASKVIQVVRLRTTQKVFASACRQIRSVKDSLSLLPMLSHPQFCVVLDCSAAIIKRNTRATFIGDTDGIFEVKKWL